MSNQKQKDRKKKERERKAKLKVRMKREQLRKEAKEKKVQEDQWDAEYAASVGKQKPWRKPQSEEELAEREEHDREIMQKLQANIEILKALEAEYEKEQAARQELNDRLEAEGHGTVKEKMDALHKHALEQQGHDADTIRQLTGGTTDLSCTSDLSLVEKAEQHISQNISEED
jgi:hypothetical protein